MHVPSSPEVGPRLSQAEEAAGRDPALARALTFIQERYADELNIEQIAAVAAVSRASLARRFIASLGEPPMRYCARWRMRVAAHRLRTTRESAANVGHAVGFQSEAAFTR